MLVDFRPKQIDSLYIDTTFCQPEAFYFPTREESADAVIELIEDWIKVLYIPKLFGFADLLTSKANKNVLTFSIRE